MARAGGLDAAPAGPLHPAARKALLAALDDGWADPTRLHGPGRRARVLLDAAGEAVAAVLGVRPDELRWCSSGAEAAQQAVLGALAGRARVGAGLVVSAIEHSAVLYAAQWHGEHALVGVNAQGRADAEAYAEAVARPGVALACLQAANGEVGTRQPIDKVAAACATWGVPLHVDAAAAVGRVEVAQWLAPADLITADARTWGGPPGVGVLARRTGVRWRRPGPREAAVVPVPLIASAAAGLLAAEAEREGLAARCPAWVQRLRAELPARIPDCVVVGPSDPAERLPHVLTASFLYVDGERLVGVLDAQGLTVASGSACVADTLEPSHVLAAMGALTHGNLRVTLGTATTQADIDGLLAALPPAVARLRAEAGVAGL